MMIIKLFDAVVNMSIAASFVIAAVILVRFLLGRAPKIFSYLLWFAVLIRLLCPVTLQADFGLVPNWDIMRIESDAAKESAQESSYHYVTEEKTGEADSNKISGDIKAEQIPESSVPGTDGNTETTYVYNTDGAAIGNGNFSFELSREDAGVFAAVWLLIGCGLLLYEAASYGSFVYRLKKEQAKISVPFVTGIVRPVIYLPAGLDETQRELITAHEKMHIRRLDYLIKPLFLFACCVHWFNPLVWAAYYLMVRDMESSCDEAVLKSIGYERKKEYAYTLLGFSTNREWKIGYPIAFGENSVKYRIKNIVKAKKAATWVVAASGFAAGVVTVLLLVNSQDTAEKITVAEYQPEKTGQEGVPGTDSNKTTTYEYYMPETVDTNGTMAHLSEELERDNRNGDTDANYEPGRDQYAVLLLETPDSYEDLEIIYGYPVENVKISENFGTRIHPVTQEERTHSGVDFAADEGTPVVAAAAGTVVKTGTDAENGNYVIVQHVNGDATYYTHCAEILTEEGKEVKAGEQIATVGSTGKSTGPHLHFAVSRKGEFIAPHFAAEETEQKTEILRETEEQIKQEMEALKETEAQLREQKERLEAEAEKSG